MIRSGLLARLATIGAVVALIAAGCTTGSAAPTGAPTVGPTAGDPTTDKLAQVLVRGTLVLWTDPDYAPQSFAVKGATRLSPTKCLANQLTAPEISGYDAETGKLVAAALGVEPCFVATPFDAMIAGSWGDRWDVAWASGAITKERMTKLYATQPYYSTPANFFVKADASYAKPADLSGKKIGACSGCTHEKYLLKTLELPGQTIDFAVTNPTIVTYNTEVPGLKDVAAGVVDAFLCSEPVGLAAIKAGTALKEITTPAYYTFKTGYVDRDLTLAPGPFVAAITKAIQELHASGKLKALSIQFFEGDYASPAGSFDLASLNQTVR